MRQRDKARCPLRGQWPGGLLGGAAGIDMSLHVLAKLLGREVAVRTAQQLECPWQPTV
jgi:hypothetical protein